MKKLGLIALLLLTSCASNKNVGCYTQSYTPKSFDEAEKWLDSLHNENNIDLSKDLGDNISIKDKLN